MTRIEAYAVPEHARIELLPRHFGRHMLTVERRIYGFMAQFASSYAGGFWRYFELGNGGLYMSPPDDEYEIRIDSNGFQGRMSADAAGITVCLFAFSAHAVQKCLYEVLLYADGEDAVMYAEAAHVVATLLEDVLDKLDGVHLRRVMEEPDPGGTLDLID